MWPSSAAKCSGLPSVQKIKGSILVETRGGGDEDEEEEEVEEEEAEETEEEEERER